MAMGFAVEHYNTQDNFEKVTSLQKVFLKCLDGAGVEYLKTDNPYIVSASFKGVNGETLMRVLQDKGVLVGIGSACSAKKAGNRILENMGLSKDEVKSHIRISFSEELSLNEVEMAGQIIIQAYKEILEKVK